MEKEIYNVAIVGMGPGGVSAGVYLARSNLNPICFEPGEIGGKLHQVREIENYPAFLGTGEELSQNLKKQVEHFNLDVRKERVININPNEDGTFQVVTDKMEYTFKSVIIANGMKEKEYEVKGSKKYNGIGISRCAECDAAFHKGKPVAVIGNTNKAYKEAIYLAEIVGKVYMVNETGEIEADKELVDDFNNMENTETISNLRIVDSEGTQHIEKLILSDGGENKREIEINGLFLFVGATPIYEFIGYMDIVNEGGFIQVDETKSTAKPGLFAIGDCSNTKLRQVVTAAGDGAVAAINCVSYLRKIKKNK